MQDKSDLVTGDQEVASCVCGGGSGCTQSNAMSGSSQGWSGWARDDIQCLLVQTDRSALVDCSGFMPRDSSLRVRQHGNVILTDLSNYLWNQAERSRLQLEMLSNRLCNK
ncbi:hypothetical protein CBL_07110 [Carabus blaptoides fortunei]